MNDTVNYYHFWSLIVRAGYGTTVGGTVFHFFSLPPVDGHTGTCRRAVRPPIENSFFGPGLIHERATLPPVNVTWLRFPFPCVMFFWKYSNVKKKKNKFVRGVYAIGISSRGSVYGVRTSETSTTCDSTTSRGETFINIVVLVFFYLSFFYLFPTSSPRQVWAVRPVVCRE